MLFPKDRIFYKDRMMSPNVTADKNIQVLPIDLKHIAICLKSIYKSTEQCQNNRFPIHSLFNEFYDPRYEADAYVKFK